MRGSKLPLQQAVPYPILSARRAPAAPELGHNRNCISLFDVVTDPCTAVEDDSAQLMTRNERVLSERVAAFENELVRVAQPGARDANDYFTLGRPRQGPLDKLNSSRLDDNNCPHER